MRGVQLIKNQLEKIDKKILSALLKDGRRKFTEIAQENNVSTSKIKKHYYKLKKNGIIQKETTHVNSKKLGYYGHMSLYINVKFNQEEIFMNYARKIRGATTYHVKLNENYNVHVLIPIKHVDEIEKNTQLIKDHPVVISFKSNIWTQIESFPENLSILSV